MGVLDASTSPPKERYAVSSDNVFKLISARNRSPMPTWHFNDCAKNNHHVFIGKDRLLHQRRRLPDGS